MEPSEIVKRCLDAGVLVSGEELARIEGGFDVYDFIKSKSAPMAEPANEPPKSGRIVVKFRKFESKDSITPSDISSACKSRYEILKSMLLSKVSALSIGNARDSSSQVSFIGVVKQVRENKFIIEDSTGEIEVSSEKNWQLDADDVVCVKGMVSEGKMLCKEVVFPDVPMLRSSGKIEAKLLLAPKPFENKADADVVLSTSPIKTEAKNVVIESSPSHLTMHKDGDKIGILFCRADLIASHEASAMLKKRHIRRPAQIMVGPDDPYVIENIPDVFWVVGAGPEWVAAYKGVTIIYGSETPILVDLKTKEAKKLL